MSLWHPMRLRWTVKLSELEIDTSKDWRGYVIKNLGAPTDPYDSVRKIDLDNLQISWDRITGKPEKYPPEPHGPSHGADPNYPTSGASDPITGWIYPSHIGPRSTDYTTPVRMWFWTRDYTGQNKLNNILSPMDSGVGRLGDSSYPWGETWTRSLYTDNIRPVASGSGGNIGASDNYYYSAYIYNIYTRYIDCGTPISGIPSSRVDADYIYNKSGDGYGYLGSSTRRWGYAYIVNLYANYLNGWNPDAHRSRHESGGADAITGWISPSYIGPRSDTASSTIFRTDNIAGTSGVNHRFHPSRDMFGYLGDTSYRWSFLYTYYSYMWELRFKGSGYAYFPADANTDCYITPMSDARSFVGTSSYRFYQVRAVYITSGDLCFEDRYCAVCGKKFKVGDSITLKVIAVDDDECRIRTIPVHVECNPHNPNPDLLKLHEEMLKPNRGNLPEEFKPKAKPFGNPEPLKEGEFEVVSVTVEDENTAMFNVIAWDGTTLSIPAPPDISDEDLNKLVQEYYEMKKQFERELEEKRRKGQAKLKRDWRGYKGKLSARKPS